MKEENLKGIGKLSRKRLVEVIRHFKGCFRAKDVAHCLQIPQAKARGLLALWAKSSWVLRIRSGLYLPVELSSESSQDIVIDPWIVAMQLYPACYVGGWTASEYWGFTDQIFSSTVVLTTKRVNGKEQSAGNMVFLVKKQSSEKMFGLKVIWKESMKVHISDPHKTIIDMLDDPALGGGIRSVSDMLQKYLQSEYFNAEVLLDYAISIGNKTIFKRLGYLLTLLKPSEEGLIEKSRQNIGKGNTQLDPALKGTRLMKKWRLWLPESIENTILENK